MRQFQDILPTPTVPFMTLLNCQKQVWVFNNADFFLGKAQACLSLHSLRPYKPMSHITGRCIQKASSVVTREILHPHFLHLTPSRNPGPWWPQAEPHSHLLHSWDNPDTWRKDTSYSGVQLKTLLAESTLLLLRDASNKSIRRAREPCRRQNTWLWHSTSAAYILLYEQIMDRVSSQNISSLSVT